MGRSPTKRADGPSEEGALTDRLIREYFERPESICSVQGVVDWVGREPLLQCGECMLARLRSVLYKLEQGEKVGPLPCKASRE